MNIFLIAIFVLFGLMVAAIILACICHCFENCINFLIEEKDALGGLGRGEDIQGLKGYFRKKEASFLGSSPYGPLDPGSRNRYVSNTSLASTGSESSESSQGSSSSQKSDASSSSYFTAPDNTPHGSMNSLNSAGPPPVAALPPPPVRVKGPSEHPPSSTHPPKHLPPPPQPKALPPHLSTNPEAVGARAANDVHTARYQALNAGSGSNASINTNPPGPQSALPAPPSGSSKK